MLSVSALICHAQNSEIDISNLYSAEGKEWKILVRPDGYQVAPSLANDLFVFFPNGKFKSGLPEVATIATENARAKTWAYNPATNILTWESTASGKSTRLEAEITYIDRGKAVLNLSENGKEPNIVVITSP